MKLAPRQSLFIVFEKPAARDGASGENFPEAAPWVSLPEKWNLRLESPFGEVRELKEVTPGSLTDNADPFVRHFSGTMVYTADAKLPVRPKGSRVTLDLGNVGDMAEVRVNGTLVGGVWTAPYTLDITDALRKGNNKIEIRIVNTWNNRLIGDTTLPEAERRTSCPVRTLRADSPLQPSGMLSQPRLLLLPL